MLRTLGSRTGSPLALALTSTLVLVLGGFWLTTPSSNPFRPEVGELALVGQIPSVASAGLLVVAGLLGLAVAAMLRRRPTPTGDAHRSGLLIAAGAATVALAAFTIDTQTISFTGYLAAMAIPVIAVALLGAALRRTRAAQATALLAAALVVWWGVASGSFAPDTIGELVEGLRAGFARVGGRPWLILLLAAASAQWASVTLRLARPWTVRWQAPSARLDQVTTIATVAAALSPAPYVVLRLAWLLPVDVWSGPIRPDDLDPAMRLWGLLLGAAAVGGGVLTIGLIRPWGCVFPAWMPAIGGRTVPVPAAAIPGYAVAFLLTASAPSMVALSITQASAGDTYALWLLLLLPMWLWGPALALATWGYVRRRRLEPSSTQTHRSGQPRFIGETA